MLPPSHSYACATANVCVCMYVHLPHKYMYACIYTCYDCVAACLAAEALQANLSSSTYCRYHLNMPCSHIRVFRCSTLKVAAISCMCFY